MRKTIRRRRFAITVMTAAVAFPLGAKAQQSEKRFTIGYLSTATLVEERPNGLYSAFVERLRELGHVEGRNLVIERRYAGGRPETLAELAAEFVRLKVDIIVCAGAVATEAARRATTTIPIVFVAGDPVGWRFVASLARPGGNLTGMSLIVAELDSKRIELFKQAVPGLSRLAILSSGAALPPTWAATEAASRGLGIEPAPVLVVHKADEFGNAFALAVQAHANGVLPLSTPLFNAEMRQIIELAAQARLPVMYEHRDFVEAGGLMSYGPSIRDVFRRAAGYVDRILKGAKPADLPVEQPTAIELVINLKTAQALGLTIPQSLLARADEVIE